ncbi:hypothetical protein GCM10027425_33630 [Alteromonas gracilis]
MSDHTPHDDAAGDLVTGGTRALLMAATVVAEQTARYYRDLKARRAAEESHTADQLGAEYNAARHLAWATVQATDQRWIDQTDPAQVARVWETAQAWARTEPETFAPAADRIADLIENHYGIDVREMATDQSLIDELQQPTETAGAREVDRDLDQAAATAVSAATSVEAVAPSETQRREQLSARLTEHDVEQDAHASRIRSSHAQAEPAEQAVRAQTRRDGKPRGAETSRGRERGKAHGRD